MLFSKILTIKKGWIENAMRVPFIYVLAPLTSNQIDINLKRKNPQRQKEIKYQPSK